MLSVRVETSDFDAKAKQLAQMPDIIRKAVVGALSDTIDDLLSRQRLEMGQVFNNPTKYVTKGLKGFYPGQGPVRSIGAKGRTGANVTQAGTYFEYFPVNSSPEDIVAPNVFGGPRRHKRSERKLWGLRGIPAGQFTAMGREYPKNNSGDIIGARYSHMLQQFGAISDTAPVKKKKGRSGKGVSYFAMVPKGGKRGDKPFAIGERDGRRIRIMLVMADTPNYPKRYKYFETGEKQVAYSLPLHFNRIIDRYMSRM